MRVLLIVDDEPLALRAMSRLLRRQFDQILPAGTPEQAVTFLETEDVTHLLCDRHLGGSVLGDEHIVNWRRQWPTIVFAALMTGDDLHGQQVSDSVDAVFPKPFDVNQLREALSH